MRLKTAHAGALPARAGGHGAGEAGLRCLLEQRQPSRVRALETRRRLRPAPGRRRPARARSTPLEQLAMSSRSTGKTGAARARGRLGCRRLAILERYKRPPEIQADTVSLVRTRETESLREPRARRRAAWSAHVRRQPRRPRPCAPPVIPSENEPLRMPRRTQRCIHCASLLLPYLLLRRVRRGRGRKTSNAGADD